MVNNQIFAHAGAKINIVNKTPLTMTTDGATMLDGRRIVTVNGQYMTLQPGNVYVNYQSLTGVSSSEPKTVNITQDAYGNLNTYDLAGLPTIPSGLDQDLYIRNGVFNQNGAINITNAEGSIYVSGEIRGEPVNIVSAGDFTLNSDGWYHIRDPRQYIDFNALDNDAASPAGPDLRTFDTAAEVSDGTKTLAAAIAETTSRIVSQGRIAITARFLNINGLIQSGVDSVDMTIDSNFVAPTYTTTLTALADQLNGFTSPALVSVAPRLPTNIPGVSFGPDNVPVDVTWDAAQRAFVFGKIDPDGGEIIIAGQILSTGGGRLKVASGYAAVNIQNSTPYRVIMDEIDTTSVRKGKITIIDSGLLSKKEYVVAGANVDEKTYAGSLVGGQIVYGAPTTITRPIGSAMSYQPPPVQYVWVEGQTLSQTIVRVYEKKSFNLIGDNFIADALVSDNSYVSEQIFPRGESRRLLESEVRELQGTPGVPVYANNKAYTLAYARRNDSVITVRPMTTLVRHTPNNRSGIVYRYIGATEKNVDLVAIDYATNSEWTSEQWSIGR